VRIERSGRFRPNELLEIQRIIKDNSLVLTNAWNEYFGA
jgi:hypothetical protein